MQWDVVAVQPVGNRTLIVTFSDGLTGKVQIGRSAKFVGETAVQLHGGIGVSEEHAI